MRFSIIYLDMLNFKTVLMSNTGYLRGWKKNYRAERSRQRSMKRQGTNREQWWDDVHAADKRRARRVRTRKFHANTKAQKTANRRSLSSAERYTKQQHTSFPRIKNAARGGLY